MGNGLTQREYAAKSPDDRSSQRAMEMFKNDPESALSGSFLCSAETINACDRSQAIMALATENPARFIQLVSQLPPLIQDIFFQYYILGRTYNQIGEVLFPQNNGYTKEKLVKEGNRAGLMGLCAVIRHKRRSAEYRSMMAFRSNGEKPKAQAPPSFGSFYVTPNGDLSQLFPSSWSVLGCRSGTAAW